MESEILKIENFNFFYDEKQILKNINLSIYNKKITTILGPSGCGKTTLLRSINRMSELNHNAKTEGAIYLNKENIYKINPIKLRQKIGMVFQRPNPFPTMTIFDNVIAGYILNGIKISKERKHQIVEKTLKDVGLWDEVKDNLFKKGTNLSGGQQQRLCIARTLAMKPDVILLDEPTSALDPKATVKIEELISKLKNQVTIILVTHNIAQAARISDYTAFLYLGELIEYGKTEEVFTVPKNKKTEEYLGGKFG